MADVTYDVQGKTVPELPQWDAVPADGVVMVSSPGKDATATVAQIREVCLDGYNVKGVDANGLTVDKNGVVALNVRTASLEADTTYVATTNKPLLSYTNFIGGKLNIGLQERLYDASREINPDALNLVTEKGLAKVLESAKKDLFIDLWNNAVGSHGTYNAETGFFELNGLTDITYEEAIAIYNTYSPVAVAGTMGSILGNSNIRTNIPYLSCLSNAGYFNLCYNCASLEVFASKADINQNFHTCFYGCENLRKVDCVLRPTATTNWFKGCKSLESVKVVIASGALAEISFSDSPKLDLASFQYIIANFAYTKLIITVHPDVYAKLTDETNTEWFALLEAAAEKNITFATNE